MVFVLEIILQVFIYQEYILNKIIGVKTGVIIHHLKEFLSHALYFLETVDKIRIKLKISVFV